ncbi:predicted protein [Chaetomium globosum CBS 148.51]|uniref:Uncharacterized protein n=1 Tax=Chaetomium globosum (strain ATCC 6205 / CBS 148.51 / DSM 1962 / NBRC 6347 / NRRL 1970) TaxID=306901 RepID=Q2H7Z4_CHAGB|nr:uncharacterized protein CHGG_03660 [Chaetomium globosum CBS 148.51]EAQ91725.1 predicted protein [Chaetomium globosum CBS 148.51]
MKTFSSAVLLLAGLAAATPVQQTRQSVGPYDIAGFTAAKTHNSGYCRFDFDVSAPGLEGDVHCSAYLDAGFSGATWLALVYEGAGNCNNDAVTWTFFQSSAEGSGASLNVTVNGVKGLYAIPPEDISVNLNDEENPFDNDVAYSGPKEFQITEFEETE